MQKKLKNTINYSKRRKQHAIDAVKKQAEAEWDRAIDADKHRRKQAVARKWTRIIANLKR
jgi:hypothetical protein